MTRNYEIQEYSGGLWWLVVAILCSCAVWLLRNAGFMFIACLIFFSVQLFFLVMWAVEVIEGRYNVAHGVTKSQIWKYQLRYHLLRCFLMLCVLFMIVCDLLSIIHSGSKASYVPFAVVAVALLFALYGCVISASPRKQCGKQDAERAQRPIKAAQLMKKRKANNELDEQRYGAGYLRLHSSLIINYALHKIWLCTREYDFSQIESVDYIDNVDYLLVGGAPAQTHRGQLYGRMFVGSLIGGSIGGIIGAMTTPPPTPARPSKPVFLHSYTLRIYTNEPRMVEIRMDKNLILTKRCVEKISQAVSMA